MLVTQARASAGEHRNCDKDESAPLVSHRNIFHNSSSDFVHSGDRPERLIQVSGERLESFANRPVRGANYCLPL